MKKWIASCAVSLALAGCAGTPIVEHQHQELEDMMGHAQLAYSEGRMADAERYLHSITERFPDAAPAWLRLGNVFYRTGRFDAAVHAYQQALRFEPKGGQAWHNLALTRMQQASAAIDEGLKSTAPNQPDHEALLRLKRSLAANDSGL